MALTPYQRRQMRMRRRNGRTAAEEAALHGDLPLVRDYLDAGYPPEQLLEMATYSRDPKRQVFWALVTHGARVDHPMKDGQTALMIAAHQGDLEFAQQLGAAGAAINAVAPDGTCALAQAALGRYVPLVTWLLDQGAIPNPGPVAMPHWSALHWAVSYAFGTQGLGHQPDARVRAQGRTIVDLLLDAGADPNVENPKGETPFTMTLSGLRGTGVLDTLNAMVAGGADINRVSEGEAGKSPMGSVMGVFFDRTRFDWLLDQGPDLDTAVSYGHSALNVALDQGTMIRDDDQAYCTRRLLAAGADPHHVLGKDGSPFSRFLKRYTATGASAFKTEAMWQAWVHSPRFRIDAPDAQGRSALLTFLTEPVLNPDLVRELIAMGANVNHQDKGGMTPLMALFRRSWGAADAEPGERVLDLLLNAGADPMAGIDCSEHDQQPTGHSLLHLAMYRKAPLGMVQRLVDLGLSINAVNAQGNTPLHLAACADAIDHVRLLLRHGANSSLVNHDGERPDEMVRSSLILVGELLADHERRELNQVSMATSPAARPRTRL